MMPNYPNSGGVNKASIPLLITSGVISVNAATTSTSGVVIIDDNYQDTPSSTKAATTNFVTTYVSSQISAAYKPVSNVVAFVNTNTSLTGLTTVLNSAGSTITLVNGNNVCLSNQTTTLQNARYTFNSGNLTLAADCAFGSNQQNTLFFETTTGNNYGVSNPLPVIVGTNTIVFSLFGANQSYFADGTSLSLNSFTNTFSIAALGVSTAKIAAAAVTYAKIQNVTANKILGNPTGSATSPTEIGLGSSLQFTSGNLDTIQPITTTSNLTFNALKLNSLTNQLQFGTSGSFSTTFTMSTLGANRTFSLPDANSNSIQGINAAVADKFVAYTDGQGFQNLAYPNLSANVTSNLTAGVITSAGSGSISSLAYSAASGTNNIMSRDSSGNSYANNITSGYTANSAGTNITLTAASPYWTDVTGGMSITLTLPNATTLINGTPYRINNASTIASTVTLTANGGAIIGYLPIGFYADLVLTNNGTTGGTWNVLVKAASLTNGTLVTANDSNVTFTMGSNPNQVCNPSAGRIYTLPTTGVPIGYPMTFTNRSAYQCTLNSSAGNAVGYLYPYSSVNVVANVATPTTAANWSLVNVGSTANVTTIPLSVTSFTSWAITSSIYVIAGSAISSCNVYGASGFVSELNQVGKTWTVYNNSSIAITFFNQSGSSTGTQFFLGGVSQFTLPAATPNAFVTFTYMVLGVTPYWVLTNTNCSKAILAPVTPETVQTGFLLENYAISYSLSTSTFNQWFDGASLTLPPGNWLMTHMSQEYGGTYQWSSMALTIYSGNNGAGQILGKSQLLIPNVTSVQYTSGTITLPPVVFSSSTTYYAKIFISNGSSTSITCMGTLIAIRLP